MIPLTDLHALLDKLATARHYGDVLFKFEGGQVKLVHSHEVWKQEEIRAKLT